MGLWQGQETFCWAGRADLEGKYGEVLGGQCCDEVLAPLLCLSNVPGAVQEWAVWLLRACSPPSIVWDSGDPPMLPSAHQGVCLGTGRCVGLCLVLTHQAEEAALQEFLVFVSVVKLFI